MSFLGDGPTESHNASIAVDVVMSLIADRIAGEEKHLKEAKEPAFMGYVSCLRVLAQEFPFQAAMVVKPDMLVEWRQCYETWFETFGTKVPKKHRESLHTNCLNEFQVIADVIDN